MHNQRDSTFDVLPTMTFAEFDSVPSRSNLPGRFALALAHANVDAQAQLQAVSFASLTQDENFARDWVKDILDQSSQEWQSLLDHKFPTSLANGMAALNGFRHYMIQDSTYIECFYRLHMEAVGKSGTFDDVKTFAAKLSANLDWVAAARDDCTQKLGVPKEVVEAETKPQGWSPALKNSIDLYNSVLKSGDWLDLHIVLLPCILGYDAIAKKLRGKPDTVRNTLYDLLWIEANAAFTTGSKYKTFINKGIDSLTDDQRKARWDDWVANFKKACGTEEGFLDLGSDPENFPAYNVVVATDGKTIVKDGIYTIRSYRKDKGYLTPGASNSVTIKDLGLDGKWELKNNVEGFSIKNVSKKTYLSVSIKSGTELSYEVTLSATEQHWSLNSIAAYNDLVSQKAYQWLVSGNFQFVLDARSHPKVVATNNSQVSDQIWVIEAAQA